MSALDPSTAGPSSPFGDPHFCMIGEPYAIQSSGWVHGAYLTVINCIQQNMLDLLPKAEADKLVAKIAYYASGCNNASLPFPNEVLSRKDVALPGANRLLSGDQVAARRLSAGLEAGMRLPTRREQRQTFRI